MTSFPSPRDLINSFPHDQIDKVYKELDRAFDDFFPIKSTNTIQAKGNYPRLNIIERDNNFIIIAGTPGLSREDLSIEYKSGVLTIRGESKQDTMDEEDKYIHRELKKSSFSRSILVDEEKIDVNKISSVYKDGELRISAPKRAEQIEKVVEININ